MNSNNFNNKENIFPTIDASKLLEEFKSTIKKE